LDVVNIYLLIYILDIAILTIIKYLIMNILTFIYFAPFFGPFLGVIAGFGVNYLYQSHKNSEDKKQYIALLSGEITLCRIILKGDTIKILPMDKWTSALNSGALKLFDVNFEVLVFTSVYNRIRNFNENPQTKVLLGSRWGGYRQEIDFEIIVKERDSLIDYLDFTLNVLSGVSPSTWTMQIP
jgi:hypothetical protein